MGCVAVLCLLMGTAGDIYRTIMTDTSGNVISTPISFSNNVVLNTTPSSPSHLARYQDITNAISGNSTILVKNGVVGWRGPVTSTNGSFQVDIEQGRLLKTNSALSTWSTMVDWSGQGLLTTNNPALYNRTSLRWDLMRLYPVDGGAGGDTPSLDWYSRYLYGNWTALSNLTVNGALVSTITNGLAPTSALSGYANLSSINRFTGTSNIFIGNVWGEGCLLLPGADCGIARGTNNAQLAMLYLNGLGGSFTNRAAITINRTAGATGNGLEYIVGGYTNFVVKPNGDMQCSNITVTGAVSMPRPHLGISTTNTITNPSATAANLIFWPSIDDNTKMFMTVTNSRIHTTEPGTYYFNFSIIMNSGSANSPTGAIWYAKNGTNVTASSTEIKFPLMSAGAAFITNCSQVISAPLFIDLDTTNDFVEIYWWGSSTTMTLLQSPTNSNPVRPLSPSAIATVFKVSR